jgi:hypothetical protein
MNILLCGHLWLETVIKDRSKVTVTFGITINN